MTWERTSEWRTWERRTLRRTSLEISHHVDRVRSALAHDGASDEVGELSGLDGEVLAGSDATDNELTGLCDCEREVGQLPNANSVRERSRTDSDRVNVGGTTSLNADESEDESEDERDEGDSARRDKGQRCREGRQKERTHPGLTLNSVLAITIVATIEITMPTSQ